MMKNQAILILVCLMAMFSECKKKEDPEPPPPASPTPSGPTINDVPAGGDFYMILQDGQMYWTQNLVTKTLYHSDYKYIERIWHSGDTLLFMLNSNGSKKLYYGSVHNPKGFKNIEFIPPAGSSGILYAGYFNGVISLYITSTGNNYRAYCDVKKGETTLTLIPYGSVNDYHSTGFFHVGHALATVANIGFQNFFLYSRDGKSWFAKQSPTLGPDIIKKVGNTVFMSSNGYLMYSTTDTSFAANSWNNLIPGSLQLDSAGNSLGDFYFCNGTWYKYGYYLCSSSGISHPHYFSSSNGANWAGDFLKGDLLSRYYLSIGPPNSMGTFLTKNYTAISLYTGANGSYSIYTSSDRATFTLNTNATAEGINFMGFMQIYFD